MSHLRLIEVRAESFPLTRSFAISRGSKRHAEVITVALGDGTHMGIGEGVPYPRYGESSTACIDTIRGFCGGRRHFDRAALLAEMPAGAARNALDCALWDLAAQRERCPVWQLAGLPAPVPVATAYTIALEAPAAMAAEARKHREHSLRKIKLGGADRSRDAERLRAIRSAAPRARLIVDVNEGWSAEILQALAPLAAELGVEMIEQPVPAGEDADLAGREWPVPLGADESLQGEFDLHRLTAIYRILNVKLDKTGGLTAAIDLVERAAALDCELMIGCMVSTSLSMIPALLLAARAQFVDLDGPLLLARDRPGGIEYIHGLMHLPAQPIWGVPRDERPLGRWV